MGSVMRHHALLWTAALLASAGCATSEYPAAPPQDVDDVAPRACAVELVDAPRTSERHGLGVLNAGDDDDPFSPGYQGRVRVAAAPGTVADLIAIVDGVATTLATGEVAGDGAARFALTLPEGVNTMLAMCRGAADDELAVSDEVAVVVDTVAPTCTTIAPAPGAAVTPLDDTAGELGDGIQLRVDGKVGGDDVEGQPVAYRVTIEGAAVEVPGAPVVASGETFAIVTFDPAATPSIAELSWTVADWAGNPCTATASHPVVYDGCAIAVVAPTAAVTIDADGSPDNGVQLDVSLAVDPACAGQHVTSDCGLDDPSGVVAADGAVALRATWCADGACELAERCTFHVTSPLGLTSSTSVELAFDNLAPEVAVELVEPALACGAEVTAEDDFAPAVPGIQARVRVASPSASTRTLEHAAPGRSTVAYTASTDVVLTLADGTNHLVGVAIDERSNVARTATCSLTVAAP